ncbi:hypothetical protein U1Q18_032960 [Sarracenia purpurea var. burkii]
MAPTFSRLFLSLLLLLLTPLSSSSPRIHDLDNNPSESAALNFPKTQAQKLIRGLNLSPKHDINVGLPAGESPADAPMMVEKPLKLPVLGDDGNSIKDLGHHAGYYRLPDTKDAR